MRLGLALGHWGRARGGEDLALTDAAERLGFDVVWAGDAYGADAPGTLSWLAAQSQGLALGTRALGISSRPPQATATLADTLSVLSQGRMRLGLDAGGNVRGARSYIEAVREAMREPVPIFLVGDSDDTLQLARDVADGVLLTGLDPSGDARRAVSATTTRRFEVDVRVAVSLDADVPCALDRLRPWLAHRLSGIVPRTDSDALHEAALRLGVGEAAAVVRRLYAIGRVEEAVRAVPAQLIDAVALVGPADRIGERLRRYAGGDVTRLSLTPYAESSERRVEALDVVARSR